MKTLLSLFLVVGACTKPEPPMTVLADMKDIYSKLGKLCFLTPMRTELVRVEDLRITNGPNAKIIYNCYLGSDEGGSTGEVTFTFRGQRLPGNASMKEVCEVQVGPAFLDRPLPLRKLLSLVDHPEVQNAIRELPDERPFEAYVRQLQVGNVHVVYQQASLPERSRPTGFVLINGCSPSLERYYVDLYRTSEPGTLLDFRPLPEPQ